MKKFNSLLEFKGFLEKIIQDEPKHINAILIAEGQLIEKESKHKFGIYQQSAGPFKAWAPLSDYTKEDRLRKGFSADDPLYRTGQLRDSIYYKVTPGKSVSIGSDDPVMAYQELGTHGAHPIPARSVLGAALFQNKRKVMKIAVEGIEIWLSGKSPIKKNPEQL